MLLYTINNLLILIWSAIFCFRKPSKPKNIIFTIIVFSQLLAIMLCREQIGYDYNMYAVGYRFMNEDGFTNLTYKDWEIGFVIMTKLLGMVLPNYIWYIGLLTIIAIVPAGIFICKHSEMPWLSTILYINTFLYFMEINFLRQAVALSIVMIAWEFMKRNKFIAFAITIIIASLFHQTVLILIPAYFMAKMKPTAKELIIYAYLLLWFAISSTGILNLITNFYHEEYNNSSFLTEGVSIIYSVLPVLTTIFAFILVKSGTINVTKENKYLINLSLMSCMMLITMSRHSIIERFSYYFLIFFILLAPVIYKSVRTSGIKLSFGETKTISITSERSKTAVAVIFVIAVLILSYVEFYYGLFENAHGTVPYNTWLRTSWSDFLMY